MASPFAADSVHATDGMSRGFMAMGVFNIAKSEYDAAADAETIALLHAKHAQTALDFAKAHGGIYVKIGQFIASLNGAAAEAIPREYIEKLAELTDGAPAQPWHVAGAVLKNEVDAATLDAMIRWVDEQPVAAGSLAQA